MKKTIAMLRLIAMLAIFTISSAGAIGYGDSKGSLIYIIFGVANFMVGAYRTWKYVKDNGMLTGKIE